MKKLLSALLLLVSCSHAPAVRAPEPQDPPEAKVEEVEQRPVAIEVGEFMPEALQHAAEQFDAQVAAGVGQVIFQINSNGGSIFAGLDFIQHVEQVRKWTGVSIICVVDVKAYSMGFVLLQSDACGARYMTKRATLLAHNGSSSAKGTALDIESDAAFLRALDRGMAELISARLGMPVAAYQEKVRGRDWTMNWVEALEVGAVDGVVEPSEIPPLQLE